jgi:replicative DNA helicase
MSESKVITAVLQDKQIHHLLQGNVDAILVTHVDIWNFIKDYYVTNSTVPPATLILEKFPDFIPEKGVGATKYHLDELRGEYLDRELRQIIRSAAEAVSDGEPTKSIEMLSTGIRNLNQEVNMVKDIDATDTDAAVDHIRRLIENSTLAHGIKTDIIGLDMCFPSGIRGGQFGIVLAYPAVGKSFLTLYLLAQAWKQGFTPMIVSLEMSETEVRNRLYTILGNGRWSLRKLSRGEIDIEEFERWHHKMFDDKHPFHIISMDSIGGEVTPEVIRSKIDQYKPDIVVADYMQLMSPSARAESEVVKMRNLSREMKLLAMSEKVPIIAISSATPTDSSDMSEPPTLAQTAWSRQMAYDADWILSLGREPSSDIMVVVGRKNREGVLPDFLMQVDMDMGMFTFKNFTEFE